MYGPHCASALLCSVVGLSNGPGISGLFNCIISESGAVIGRPSRYQVSEIALEVCFVVPPRYSLDPGGRVLGYRIERVPQSFRCDVV